MWNRKIKKEGWFVGRGYRHFDHPLNFYSAKKLVTSSNQVSVHNFLPLLSYKKTVRRFKGYRENGTPLIRHKSRLICYASHRDAQIYAYYAHNLEYHYESFRRRYDIDDCVIGYVQGKGSNIEMANTAFEEIKKRKSCSVLAMDISDFFGSIDHLLLKKALCQVLGVKRLPEDYYKLYKSITRFSRVDLVDCFKVLKLEKKLLKKSTRPLCDFSDFHQKICGRGEGYKDLVITNSNRHNPNGSLEWNAYGIPQGTPISAIFSNISMINFDIYMNRLVKKLNGVYWRYSDDIFIICPTEHEISLESEVEKIIAGQGTKLKINTAKTEIARFQYDNNKAICQIRKKNDSWTTGSVQYLGLCFNGEKKALRHTTIAKYQRKTKYAVRNARRTAKHFKKDKISSKKLYLQLTDIGSQSMPSYAARASKITGDLTAKKQLGNHKQKLSLLIEKENKKIKK